MRNAPRVVIAAPSGRPLFRRVSRCVQSFAESRVCVPAFACESERGPFCRRLRQELFCRVVPIDGSRGWVFVTAFERPLKSVWPMHWIRWYDCVSCAFRSFSEDEKESRINGWHRNRRSAQSLLPAVRAVDGGFSAVGCGTFCERFQSGWRLNSCKRRCPKDFSGTLWPFRKEIEVITFA